MVTVPSPTPPFQPHDVLERIMLQMASCLDLQLVLTAITQGLIDKLDGAFARIWLLGLGDLCAGLTCPLSFDEAIKALMKVNPKAQKKQAKVQKGK